MSSSTGPVLTQISRELEQEILQAVRDVRYGSVEITIHDAQVVQIERREKVRVRRVSAAART